MADTATLARCIEAMEAALINADVDILLQLGDVQEATSARLWRGDVLVDWERDDAAGGCLLRPALVRRLLQLKAAAEWHATSRELHLRAASRLVLALSPAHAQLIGRLGDLAELQVVLRFAADGTAPGSYLGGEEQYRVVVPGRRAARVQPVLLRLSVRVRPRPA